jgi:hypothetical protein
MKLLLMIGMILVSCSGFAQDSNASVKSLDGTIEALYGSISGEKGEARKWDLFQSLFTENAMLVPTVQNDDGVATLRPMTPGEYMDNANEWLVNNGFHEVEIHRVVDQYGPVVHIFSTYESRRSIKDESPFARGINSIQLLNDGNRWWIMTIYWSGETPDNPIPDKYLPK